MSAESVLYAVFDGLDRLGPGSESSTFRALEAARRVVEPERILDIGCGTGSQTRVLARHTAASIVAVDTGAAFLKTLEARAADAGVAERVATREMSMTALDFPAESFDLIWSEGSAYIMGFDAALTDWRRFLRPGGVLACSELSWLTGAPSERAAAFWATYYPAMRDADGNIAAAEAAGYRCIEQFALPASDWLDEYYGPVLARMPELRERYRGDADAEPVLSELEAEIDLYRACGSEYGYVFYILKRD